MYWLVPWQTHPETVITNKSEKWQTDPETVITNTSEKWRGYLLPTWARKITCWRFDWMLQSSSVLGFDLGVEKTIVLMTTGAFSRNVGKLFSKLELVPDNLLFISAEANWEATERVRKWLEGKPLMTSTLPKLSGSTYMFLVEYLC